MACSPPARHPPIATVKLVPGSRTQCAVATTLPACRLRLICACLTSDRLKEFDPTEFSVDLAKSPDARFLTEALQDTSNTKNARIAVRQLLGCQASFGNATFVDEIWKTICNLEFRKAKFGKRRVIKSFVAGSLLGTLKVAV